MKQNIGPLAIAGAVVALIIIVSLIYRATLGSHGPQPTRAEGENAKRNISQQYQQTYQQQHGATAGPATAGPATGTPPGPAGR